ncbi:acetate--CoA ligase family protein [Amycolatopsis ultiminotia]|uniref:Acetate--CoA ligase family protein n=1 Tax=Amycolatopsis ultiminotia TaxID=543629 RepID=A0ABP6XWV8_9PSEU
MTTEQSTRLAAMFNPASVALIGASDRSAWSRTILHNLVNGGYAGDVHLVSRRGEPAHGRPTVTSVGELPSPPDLAYLLMRSEAVFPALQEAARAGVRNFVIPGAGFGEAGPPGTALEHEVASYCRAHGLTVLGPNNLGFVNLADSVYGYALEVGDLPRGGISIISQSGALAWKLMGYVPSRGAGLDHVITVGNEAVLDAADCLEHLLSVPSTTVICLYLHAIRNPGKFARMCRRAAVEGKPVVVFKVGSGAQSARAAVAHTGGLVGNDRAIEAVLRHNGAIRTASVEEMITTAIVLEGYGELPGTRAAVLSGAGSACEMLSDRADRLGMTLPELTAETRDKLVTAGLPAFATAQNPLDVTAAVTIDHPDFLDDFARIMLEDPGVDLLIIQGLGLGNPFDPRRRENAQSLRDLQSSSAKPVLVFADLTGDAVEDWQALRAEFGTPPVVESIDRGLLALHRSGWWSRTRKQLLTEPDPAPAGSPGTAGQLGTGGWSEWSARDYLAGQGVPMVPARLARSSAEAAVAAGQLGFPVVMKICSPDILHKSDAGGVVLDVRTAAEAGSVFDELTTRAGVAEPAAAVEGVLISPLRSGGVELIAGVTRDPDWGLMLAIGLGGVWVEVLEDVALRQLPVTPQQVESMLGELRGAPLLRGARGIPPADIPVLARAIHRLTIAALDLGEAVQAVEVNPLLVRGTQVEALDALIVRGDSA